MSRTAKNTSTSSIGDDVRAAHQGELYGIPYDATQGKLIFVRLS